MKSVIFLHLFASLWISVNGMALSGREHIQHHPKSMQNDSAKTGKENTLLYRRDNERKSTLGAVFYERDTTKVDSLLDGSPTDKITSVISSEPQLSSRSSRPKELRKISKRKKSKSTRRKKHKHNQTVEDLGYTGNSRTYRRLGRGRQACKTKSKYVVLTEAVDMLGNTVKLAPLLEVDGMAVNQIFHESYCDVESCRCRGVNSHIFESSCETNYMYTYARVIKENKITWAHIKVRSGCSCVIREKWQQAQGNILDLI